MKTVNKSKNRSFQLFTMHAETS